MPDLNISHEVAKTRFRSFNIVLAPTPAAKGLQQKLPASSLLQQRSAAVIAHSTGAAATPMPFPPCLFRVGSKSSADVDYQKAMHASYNQLFDGLLDAIQHGFNQFRQTASLQGVQINGPLATGGRLLGPSLVPLIATAPSVASWTGRNAMVRSAVAEGVDYQWSALARSVRVPGLPWYPALAQFPSPLAPATPNVPTPFITLAHNALATSPANLRVAMRARLQGQMDFADQFFESLSFAFDSALQVWKRIQLVSKVMGMGSCPSFAPPYVPVAPVVNGYISPGAHIKG